MSGVTQTGQRGSATPAPAARRRARRAGRWVPLVVLVLPALALYGWFFVSPIIQNGFYSLFDWNSISPAVFVGLDNYVALAQDPVFHRALINTGYMLVLLLGVLLPIAFLLAWFIYRQIPGHAFLRTVYFVPYVISSVAIALLFSFLYEANFGLINSALRSWGWDHLALDWLGNPTTAMTAVTLPLLFSHFGLIMIILLAGMQGLPSEILEAAEVDGVNGFQRIIYVVLPLLRGSIGVCALLLVTTAFKVFDFILLLTRGGPAHLTEVTGSYLYNAGYQQFKYGYGSAIASTILIIVAVFLILLQLIRRRQERSA